MAIYDDLIPFFDNGPLKRKVGFSMISVANDIREEDPGTTNHDNRVIWAKKVLSQLKVNLGGEELDKILWLILAENSDLTIAQISSATDAVVKGQVETMINFVADGS